VVTGKGSPLLDSFIMSLKVGVGPNRPVILIEGLEGSVGNDVS
jgi:hypothetical protein